MSKIISAINSMIINENKISDVLKPNNELFFKYDNKYIWGIVKTEQGNIILYFYPKNKDVKELVGTNWQNVPMISYDSNDFKSREAQESFNELYTLIIEKQYNVNDALEDIIGI